MKLPFVFCIVFCLSFKLNAQKFEWMKGSYTSSVTAERILTQTDSQGNIFTAGVFGGYLINGTDTVWSYLSSMCSFISKYDPSGVHLWTKPFAPLNSKPVDMCIDSDGNIFMSLSLYNAFTYIDEDTTFSLSGGACLLSFSNNGTLRWGISHPTQSWQFPVAASLQHTGFYSASGNVVYRFNTNGNVIWSRTATGPASANFLFRGIDCNDQNTLIVCGITGAFTTGQVSLDTVTVNIATDVSDMAFFRLDTAGGVYWGKVQAAIAHGGTWNMIHQMLVNQASEFYYLFDKSTGMISYVFGNDTIFNPYCTNCSFSAVLKFDPSGNPIWARNGFVGSFHVSSPYDFVFNDNEDLILTASTNSPDNYFGSSYYDNTTGLGSYSTLLVGKLSAQGNPVWMKSDHRLRGQLVYDYVSSISNGVNNTVNITGRRSLGLAGAFHLGCHSDSIITPSGTDMFLASISDDPEPLPDIQVEITQNGNRVVAQNYTQNADGVIWTFGDGSPSQTYPEPYHTYTQPGVYSLCVTAENACGQSAECYQINVRGIREIRARQGSNDGIITTEIFGGGFTPAALVKLIRQSGGDILPLATQFVNSGKIIARFDLNGQPVTTCDVEVEVPGDTIMVLPDGFRIIQGTGDQLEVSASGSVSARPGWWVPKTILVRNTSGRDAVGVPVFFRIRNSSTDHFMSSSLADPALVPFAVSGADYLANNGLDPALMSYLTEDPSTVSSYGGFVIPLLKAGETWMRTVYIQSSINQQFTFAAFAFKSLASNSSLAGNVQTGNDPCLGEYLKRAIENTFSIQVGSSVWNTCFQSLNDSVLNSVASMATGLIQGPEISFNAYLVAMFSEIAGNGCVPGFPSVLTNAQVQSLTANVTGNLLLNYNIGDGFQCSALNQYRVQSLDPPSVLTNEFCDLVQGIHVSPFSSLNMVSALQCQNFNNSIDPNSKQGPGDNAADIYIRPGIMLPYTVSFENLPSATAPASEVIITDTLDMTKLDIGTFEFGPVYISDSIRIHFPEPGLEQIQFTPIPGTGNMIRTLAQLDTVAGVVTWRFSTVFASDKQLNPDPQQGFLPPNLSGSEGMGFCTFTVDARQNLVTGDQIDNEAEIIFDNNPPIVTNIWTNIVDIDKPQSAVDPLPPNISTSQFSIDWSGSDMISGVRAYKIFVSENDGPYQMLLPFSDSVTTVFNGINGNKYEFFSVALDKAGNMEDPPFNPEQNPDAVTTVVVGLSENSQWPAFTVYPNPVKDLLYIQFNSQEFPRGVFSVENSLGQEISFDSRIPTLDASFIDVSGLASGIYTLTLTSPSGDKQRNRFIKVP